MHLRYQERRWWVAVIMSVVAINIWLFPNQGETRGLVPVLMMQPVSQKPDMASPYCGLMKSERASASMVGTIMTLLATFDEAGVLPPEGTAHANQVIHGLIQFQAALAKSPSPQLASYRQAAAAYWMSQQPGLQDDVLREEGLTDQVLGSLMLYDQKYPIWQDRKIVEALRAFNVTQEDWILIVELFEKADKVFQGQGRSIYKVYDVWRLKMPKGKS